MRRMTIEERRAELIAAAIRVISRDGLASASTRAIVAEAEMPLGAFHYVFASREELIAAVIEEVTDAERMAALTAAAVAPGDGPVDLETLLRRGLRGYLTYLEDTPGNELALFEVALHAVRHNPEAVQGQWETYRRASEDALVRAAELAGIRWTRPTAELAHVLTRSVDGLTITWLADRDRAAALAYIDFLAASFAALAEPVAGPAAASDELTPTSTPSPDAEGAPC